MATRCRPVVPVNPTRVGQRLLIGHCLSLVGDCGHLSNDRITLVGWHVLRYLAQSSANFLSQPRKLQFLPPGRWERVLPAHTPVPAQARGDVAGCDLGSSVIRAHVAMSTANTLSSRLTPAAITRTGRCFRHDDSNALNEMTPLSSQATAFEPTRYVSWPKSRLHNPQYGTRK